MCGGQVEMWWGGGGRKKRQKEQWLPNGNRQKQEVRAVLVFYNALSHTLLSFLRSSRKKCYIYFKDKMKWERYKRSHNNKERHESQGLCYPAMGNEWLLKQTAVSSNPWQNVKTKLCELWIELWCYFSLAQSVVRSWEWTSDCHWQWFVCFYYRVSTEIFHDD